jgi:hypothetical protein
MAPLRKHLIVVATLIGAFAILALPIGSAKAAPMRPATCGVYTQISTSPRTTFNYTIWDPGTQINFTYPWQTVSVYADGCHNSYSRASTVIPYGAPYGVFSTVLYDCNGNRLWSTENDVGYSPGTGQQLVIYSHTSHGPPCVYASTFNKNYSNQYGPTTFTPKVNV